MALSELKSNLANFRKPIPTKVEDKTTRGVNKNFKTTPLAERAMDFDKSFSNVSKLSSGDTSDLNIDNIPASYSPPQRQSPIDISKLGKTVEKTVVDTTNNTSISGRHLSGVDVARFDNSSDKKSTIDISRTPSGTNNLTSPGDVSNNSVLSGRHVSRTEVNELSITPNKVGMDVVNGSDLAGRHAIGKDVINNINIPVKSPTNIDDSKYTNTVSNYGSYTPPIDRDFSSFDIDGNIEKYENIVPITGNSLLDRSEFNIDSIPTRYQIQSRLIPVSFKRTDNDIDFIPSSYAKGKSITSNLPGVAGTVFEYPTNINGGRAVNIGQYKLSNQIDPTTTILNITGWSVSNKYGLSIGKLGQLGPRYIVKNSPSFLDEQYNKFNLRDESWNPTWVRHPLILRGIQQEGGTEPQFWGTRSLGFTDPFVRGGALVSTTRAAIDLVRISKFMASPKGLLFIGKQVGLQLSNPKVETIDPIGLSRTTRIYNLGLTELANVAVQHLGLRLPRHGVTPLDVEITKYENVVKTLGGLSTLGTPFETNRLAKLKNELLANLPVPDVNKKRTAVGSLLNKIGELFRSYTSFGKTPIRTLSGLAGPNSLYGIGTTIHRRHVNSIPFDAGRYIFYNINSQYASSVGSSLFGNTQGLDDDLKTVEKVEKSDRSLHSLHKGSDVGTGGQDSLGQNYPYTTKFENLGDSPGGDKSTRLNESPYDNPIQNYRVMAYNQIPKNRFDRLRSSGFNDFRSIIEKNGDTNIFGSSDRAGTELGKDGNLHYDITNRERRTGWGEQGTPGANRSDYTAHSGRGDRINLKDIAKRSLNDLQSDEYKDMIEFYFGGPNLVGAGSDIVIPFRANIGSFTDTPTPSWNNIEMLGRADFAYLYSSFERTINFDFKVAATSREEMKPMWRKINYLTSYTTPEYKQGLKSPFMRLTIGNLFQETPGFINSLTITVDEQTPWEINLENDVDMGQLPMIVSINVGFTVVHDFRPQIGGRLYSLSPRGKSNLSETEGNWLFDASLDADRSIFK